MNRALTIAAAAALVAAGCGIGDAQTQLRTAVDAKNDELNQCYARALERDRNTSGTMQARLHVSDRTGRLEQVEFTEGNVQDQALQSCMSDTLTQVQLEEAPAANLDVQYTFQLQPQQ